MKTVTATVLIIEDEPHIRQSLRQTLETAGYAVLEAENGIRGVSLYKSAPPDLVLTDIVMPDKDGLETIREICRVDPRATIIAMSAIEYGQMDFLEVAKRFGAAASLRKPFDPHELLACVGWALRTRQARSIRR